MKTYPMLEFHVARSAREKYQFDDTLFAYNGNVLFANFHAARVFAQKINDQRDTVRFPEQTVPASLINGVGLIDEMLHHILAQYRQQLNPGVMAAALAALRDSLGPERIEDALVAFCDAFPPRPVYNGEMTTLEYLAGQVDGVPHREVVLEELLFLWLNNQNPVNRPLAELIDDSELAETTAYSAVIEQLERFFADQPPFGPENQSVFELLQVPARRFPDSIEAQLEFMRTYFEALISPFMYRLLGSLDLIAEEGRLFLNMGTGGPGPAEVIDFKRQMGAGSFSLSEGFPEPEQFSQDLDWMPRLVLIAKNAYVWLDQLSKKYARAIERLDQIPDEELDFLGRAGFSGLWLIGLWERSAASKTIKHLCGNPDAVASAYSLYDYAIAERLGGDAAYDNLRTRARERGIRMSSDMVPNHMGIDSRWVVEHPDWFISLPYSPYPGYTFNGPNLSLDQRVGIYLEDHYYSKSDAAVVFKRVDHYTGDARYIYHGNDGTSMPWNDTAQLDFLNPDVREAVIQTILHVARRSSIIRFDAAMVLAKKHIERLWYPEPGVGGSVPSRNDFAMTRQEFNARMPVEFWREVVDRVAAEEPDTLLLAEAFWLMEGYFVRTLGMHRVYNSAFMHMLRDEKNGEYRLVMRNTLEFNPEILKRYVNFMNNPDEETAISQFGKGDKYFGVAAMMATLPGLPMVGHGQLEGFTEKYGMEYQRSYYNEQPDQYLLDRHEREIYPLFRRRYLFAEVENFFLYDFVQSDGSVNEDVFAYSNMRGGERSLFIFHNKWAETAGWIRMSVGFSVPAGANTEERVIIQRSLGDALQLPTSEDSYVIFRDHPTGLEYIRSCADLHQQGLFVQLNAYRHHVFLDFQIASDDAERTLAGLNAYLNGRGVASIDEARRELALADVISAYRALVNSGNFRRLLAVRASDDDSRAELLDDQEANMRALLEAAAHEIGGVAVLDPDEAETRHNEWSAQARQLLEVALSTKLIEDASVAAYLPPELSNGEPAGWGPVFGLIFTQPLGRLVDDQDPALHSRGLLDDWLLSKVLGGALREMGLDEGAASRRRELLNLLVTQQDWLATANDNAYTTLTGWLVDKDVRQFLQVNRFEEVLWFNKESFAELRLWLFWSALFQLEVETAAGSLSAAARDAALVTAQQMMDQLAKAEEQSEYQVEKLLDALLLEMTPTPEPATAAGTTAAAAADDEQPLDADRPAATDPDDDDVQ